MTMEKHESSKNNKKKQKQAKTEKDLQAVKKAPMQVVKKEKYQTYILCEFIKEAIYKQTMSPQGLQVTPDSEVSSCDLLTPGSEGEGPFNVEIRSGTGDSKVVKEKVKMVVGDLENVLGELKTVVGDLRVLVDQIDVVTSKIDEEYGVEFRMSEEFESDAEAHHRRLGSNAGEDSNHNQMVPFTRHSVANPYDVKYAKPDWLYLDVNRKSRSPSKPGKEGMVNMSHLKRTTRSSDTSGCVVSPRSSGDGNGNATRSQRHQKTNGDRQESEAGPPNQRRNKRTKNTKRTQAKNSLDVNPFDLSDLSPDDLVRKPRSRSLSSANPHHTHCSPCSPSPDADDYCGVYERELEMRLELEYDDNLSNYNGIDEQNSFELESFKEFRIRYRENLNNAWTAYARDPPGGKVPELEDPFLDSGTDVSSSDILNDNLAGSETSQSNYDGFNPWGRSFDSSDIG